MYIRHLQSTLKQHFQTYRQALILLGARQVGKTTLLKNIFPEAHYLLLDNQTTKNTLESYDIQTYKQVLGPHKQIILDELHLLSNPGRAVKIIYDQLPQVQLIVTGSSSLHIKNKTSESMAGRKIDYHLYPLTFSEYLTQTNTQSQLNYNLLNNIEQRLKKPPHRLVDTSTLVDNVLLFGLYPEILQLPQDQKYLHNLADSVVFKDIIELNLIDNKTKAKQLLKLLAYQIGNLINYSELSNKLQLDQRTVKRYLNIFEDSFIIYRLYPYSNKKRGEIVKSPKIYFWDIGLRNALINNFADLSIRADSGAMFENFIISEVKKINTYQNNPYQLHYWRTKSGSEVDLVLSKPDILIGCEIKQKKGNLSSAFLNRYPQAQSHLITKNNFY